MQADACGGSFLSSVPAVGGRRTETSLFAQDHKPGFSVVNYEIAVDALTIF
jgi:hypothetical protein